MDRSQIIQSFVARIWLERGKDGDPQWRGHIQHIQGQEEVYFQDLREVGEFLEQISGIRAPGFAAAQGHDAQLARSNACSGRKSKANKQRNN